MEKAVEKRWTLRGPKDNQFIACSCGHCVYRPEEICYTERTAPCNKYETGCEPITLHLKRHVFQK